MKILFLKPITPQQYKVWCLVAQGVVDISHIAYLLGTGRVNVSRALSSLQNHGLVRRPHAQPRSAGKFKRYPYEALNTDGEPFSI